MHRVGYSGMLAVAVALAGCTAMRDSTATRHSSFPRLDAESASILDGAVEGVLPPRNAGKAPAAGGDLVLTSGLVPQEEVIDLGMPAMGGPAPMPHGVPAADGGIVELGSAADGNCANGTCAVGGGRLGRGRGERGPNGEELLQQANANLTGYRRKLRGDMGNNPQQPRELRMASHPIYVVEPPDILYIEALDTEPNQPVQGERLVRPDGTISLGYYGQIHVAGLTLPEIERKIRGQLEKTVQHPRVYVDVVSFNSKVFYVLGQVQNQGRLPITGKEHVLDAIVQAGGLTNYADVNRIYLARPAPGGGCHQIFKIDYQSITSCGDSRTNYQLLPGDRVFVTPTSGYKTLNWMDNYITPVERITNLFALFRFATVPR